MSNISTAENPTQKLISVIEYGFLKIHQRLLRHEVQLSAIESNASGDAKLATLRQKDLLNMLKLIYENARGGSTEPATKVPYQIDFAKNVQGHLKDWTFHYSPLCFKIRELLQKYEGCEDVQLKSEQEERRLFHYLAQIISAKKSTVETSARRMNRIGYFRFLRHVIECMTTFHPVPEKKAVRYVSVQLCEFWNCGLTFVKSYRTNKCIHLVSFEDVFQDLWRIMKERNYRAIYRARRNAAATVTPVPSARRRAVVGTGARSSQPSKHQRFGHAQRYRPSVLDSDESDDSSVGSSSSIDLGDCDTSDSDMHSDGAAASYYSDGELEEDGCSVISTGTRRSAARSVSSAPSRSPSCATPSNNYWEDTVSPERISQRTRFSVSQVSEPPSSQQSQLSQPSQSSQSSSRITRSSAKMSAAATFSKKCTTRRSARKYSVRSGLLSSLCDTDMEAEPDDSSACRSEAASTAEGRSWGNRTFAEVEEHWWSTVRDDKRVGAFHNFTPLSSSDSAANSTTRKLRSRNQSPPSGQSQSQSSVVQELQSQHEATLAQHAAVCSAYEQACAIEQRLLQSTDCGLLARLSFLDGSSPPPSSSSRARSVSVEGRSIKTQPEVQRNGTSHDQSDDEQPAAKPASSSRAATSTGPSPASSTASTAAVDKAPSPNPSPRLPVQVRRSPSSNFGLVAAMSPGGNTHIYFSDAEVEQEDGSDGDSEPEAHPAKKQKQKADGDTSRSLAPSAVLNKHEKHIAASPHPQVARVAEIAAATTAATPLVFDPAAAANGAVVTMVAAAAERSSSVVDIGLSATPVRTGGISSNTGSKSSKSSYNSHDSSGSSSSNSVCTASSFGSPRTSASNNSSCSVASSCNSVITPFRLADSVPGPGASPDSAIRTFPDLDLLDEHTDKQHKHRKHHKHKRHRHREEEHGDADAVPNTEEKRKRKHKHKHRDKSKKSMDVTSTNSE